MSCLDVISFDVEKTANLPLYQGMSATPLAEQAKYHRLTPVIVLGRVSPTNHAKYNFICTLATLFWLWVRGLLLSNWGSAVE